MRRQSKCRSIRFRAWRARRRRVDPSAARTMAFMSSVSLSGVTRQPLSRAGSVLTRTLASRKTSRSAAFGDSSCELCAPHHCSTLSRGRQPRHPPTCRSAAYAGSPKSRRCPQSSRVRRAALHIPAATGNRTPCRGRLCAAHDCRHDGRLAQAEMSESAVFDQLLRRSVGETRFESLRSSNQSARNRH